MIHSDFGSGETHCKRSLYFLLSLCIRPVLFIFSPVIPSFVRISGQVNRLILRSIDRSDRDLVEEGLRLVRVVCTKNEGNKGEVNVTASCGILRGVGFCV